MTIHARLASIERFISSLPAESEIAGKGFESMSKYALQTMRIPDLDIVLVERYETFAVKHNAKLVDVPESRHLPTQDEGIDFVAHLSDGTVVPVQAKLRRNGSASVDPVQKLGYLTHRISGLGAYGAHTAILITNRASRPAVMEANASDPTRILVITSREIAQYMDHEMPALDEIKKALYPAGSAFSPKTYRDDQIESGDAVISEWESSDRTCLYSACGTGKTMISVYLSQKIRALLAAFLAPTRALISQTVQTFREQVEDIVIFTVCSDEAVHRGKGGTEEDMSSAEFERRVRAAGGRNFTRNQGKELAAAVEEARLARPEALIVILSTYLSSYALHVAQANGMDQFDLMFCDESHHLVQSETIRKTGDGKDMAIKVIRSQRRVFATATPRSITYKQNARMRGHSASDIPSMPTKLSPSPHFGTVAFDRPFSEAISMGLLCPYNVLVPMLPESSLRDVLDSEWNGDEDSVYHFIDRNGDIIIDAKGTLDMHAVARSIRRAFDDHGVRRFVVYFRTIADSMLFASIAERVTGIPAFHMDGSTPHRSREAIFGKMSHRDAVTRGCIISNAGVLSEGIDIASLDAVVIADPVASVTKVIQIVGRAIRRHTDEDGVSKKYGYVIVPTIIPLSEEDGDFEEMSERISRADERFDRVANILNALAQHDESLRDVLAATMKSAIVDRDRGHSPLIEDGDIDAPEQTGDARSIDVEENGSKITLDFSDIVRMDGAPSVEVARKIMDGISLRSFRMKMDGSDYSQSLLVGDVIYDLMTKEDREAYEELGLVGFVQAGLCAPYIRFADEYNAEVSRRKELRRVERAEKRAKAPTMMTS